MSSLNDIAQKLTEFATYSKSRRSRHMRDFVVMIRELVQSLGFGKDGLLVRHHITKWAKDESALIDIIESITIIEHNMLSRNKESLPSNNNNNLFDSRLGLATIEDISNKQEDSLVDALEIDARDAFLEVIETHEHQQIEGFDLLFSNALFAHLSKIEELV